jgi:hypothetical protein
MKPIVLVFSMFCVPALAAPTGFAERARYGSGAAIIEPAVGGEYVHAQQLGDARMRTRPVLTAVPVRQSYVFFSAEEEQALLRYRDQQLASLLKERLVVARKRHYRATGKLDWPKVVVRADEICVPELASSEAADWRDHLVCHRGRASQ